MTSEEREPLPLGEHRDPATFAPSASASPVASAESIAPSISRSKLTYALSIATAGAVLGSSFQFGYNNSVINTPAGEIKAWLNATLNHDDSHHSTDRVTLIFSIVVSIWAVGGLIGGLLAGLAADRYGRRGAMLLNNVVALLAAVLMGVAKPASSFVPLVLGRFVSGINCGANTALPTMYISEISPSHLRGALGVVHQLVVVSGILLSQVVGLPSLFGSADLWPWALAFTAVPALIQPVIFLFAPESPRFLLINRGDALGAEKSLSKLRGNAARTETAFAAIAAELREIKDEAERESAAPKVGLRSIVKSPILRQPFAVMMVLHLSQQLSGINGIFYYSTELYKSVGLPPTDAIYASIGTSGFLVLATLISIPLMDRAGRRTLMLVGLGSIVVFEVLLTVTLTCGGERYEGYLDTKALRYVSVVAIVATVAAFAIGPGSIPWFFPAEIFPQGARAKAMSAGCAVNWLANFVVGVSFEHLQEAVGSFCFLPFVGVSVIFWLFTWARMPETKKKSFEEINEIFEERARK